MTIHAAPSPLLHGVTVLAFVLHIGGGTVGLASGLVAAFARKGGGLHRMAGTVFVASMLDMAVFAVYLAVTVPGPFVNLFIGTFAFYLVATAWVTVRRAFGAIGLSEKIALLVALLLFAPFAILSCELAPGASPFFKSTVPLEGPVLVAIYGFTSVLALAAIGDVRLVLAGGIAGTPRIARHLWRMCLGLTLAVGSFFTNALPRLLLHRIPVTGVFFIPQPLTLGLMIYWLIRVRFLDWRQPLKLN